MSIAADFPYQSRFIEINNSKVHYIEEGQGDPILFLHGNPTSSYLWRNIIPYLSDKGRCIAPDLIGMGKSDKPNIKYTFLEHYQYIKTFIDSLGLQNLTLVIHDWGSALGFHYAKEHPEKIKGIAFMEAIYRPWRWSYLPAKYRVIFRMMRTPYLGWMMVCAANMFIKSMLPKNIMRKLSEEEMKHYQAPYASIKSRQPLLVWTREIPFNKNPRSVHEVVDAYNQWLKSNDIPKLCLYASPGAILSKKEAESLQSDFPNTKSVNVGKGLHFLQEDQPDEIGKTISAWYTTI
ncbi:MAG TPA: haloalkane dehalogenase [Cyclobacteriaceae bacterium]